MNVALVAVAEADVPVLSFEVEGARLSDAFLKMTSLKMTGEAVA